LDAFRRKEIPFTTLGPKIEAWKAMSQAISRKYTPLKTFEHAPEGAIHKTVEQNSKTNIESVSLRPSEVIQYSWYTSKDTNLISKLYE